MLNRRYAGIKPLYPSNVPAVPATNAVVRLFGENIVGVADGGVVPIWPDTSGNNNSPVQFTAANQPAFRATGGPNSRACVETDGAAPANTDYLRKAFTWNQPAHVFLVAKYLTAPASGDTLIDGGVANGLRLYNNSGKYSLFAGAGLDAAQSVDTGWHLFEIVFNGASSSIRVDNNAAATGNAGATNPAGLIIGVAGDLGTGPSDARFAALVGYSAVQSAETIAAIRASLQKFYNL